MTDEDIRRLRYVSELRKHGEEADPYKVELKCPAAALLNGKRGECGVHCRVDGSFVGSITSPNGFYGYCTGEYTRCPVWEHEKKNLVALNPERTKH